MTKAARYLDASALVKLIVDEEHSAALRALVADGSPAVTSVIGVIEVRRAIARAGVAQELTRRVTDGIVVVGLTAAIAERAASLAPATLRTLDALHLSTALELGDDLGTFVAYDDRLAAAARAQGLDVIAPGIEEP
jgi:predicted nucleic acid-binding protein